MSASYLNETAPGIFISLEGGEGCGKSTQIRRVADALRATGREVVTTREPGGTPGAEAVRRLMLDPDTDLDPLADMMLVFAARADHVARLIRPAIARGAIVLSDRFADSTMAYQGYGLGVDLDVIQQMIRIIGFKPHATIVLDMDPDLAAQRVASRGGPADRYENFDRGFAARTINGFRAIAAAEPDRCTLIDAKGAPEEVTERVLPALAARFPELRL